MAKIGIILSGAASKGAYEYGFLKGAVNFSGLTALNVSARHQSVCLPHSR